MHLFDFFDEQDHMYFNSLNNDIVEQMEEMERMYKADIQHIKATYDWDETYSFIEKL